VQQDDAAPEDSGRPPLGPAGRTGAGPLAPAGSLGESVAASLADSTLRSGLLQFLSDTLFGSAAIMPRQPLGRRLPGAVAARWIRAGVPFLKSVSRQDLDLVPASRRLNSDRFLTKDVTPAVYTAAGMEWLAENTRSSVILRHYPELRAAMRSAPNAFTPRQRCSRGAGR
jgi:hypothetical protein